MSARPILASAVALALAACAAVTPRQEAVLRVEPPVPAASPRPLSPRIALSPVGAEAGASGRRYAYVDPAAPGEVRQAATLFWEAPPQQMLEQALSQGLTARLGVPVLPVSVAGGAERRLTVGLDRFEERSGPQAQARVAFQAVLTDVRSRELMFDRRYCVQSPIGGASPSARAAAFAAATGAALDRLAADLARPAAPAQAVTC